MPIRLAGKDYHVDRSVIIEEVFGIRGFYDDEDGENIGSGQSADTGNTTLKTEPATEGIGCSWETFAKTLREAIDNRFISLPPMEVEN